MPCLSCGTKNQGDARFCTGCGTRLDTATARSDDGEGGGRLSVRNRATVVADRYEALWNAGDVAGVWALWQPAGTVEARRSVVSSGVTHGEETRRAIAGLIELFPRAHKMILAVRGDRHCVQRFEMTNDGGSELEFVSVISLAEDGRIEWGATFDVDRCSEAMRVLDERYAAHEGLPYRDRISVYTEFLASLEAKSASGIRRVLAPDCEIIAGPGLAWSTMGVEEYIGSVGTIGDAALVVRLVDGEWISPDVAVCRIHSRIGPPDDFVAYEYATAIAFGNGVINSIGVFEVEDADAAYELARGLLATP